MILWMGECSSCDMRVYKYMIGKEDIGSRVCFR